MYAFTSNSFRAIASGDTLYPGEQAGEVVPEIVLSEIKGLEARAKRVSLLRSSDWTQVQDNNLTGIERASWSAYRQLLRDIPQQPGFPQSIQWPVAPTMRPDSGDELPQQS